MSAKILHLFFLTVSLLGLSSCFRNYYKVATETRPDARQTGSKLDSLSAAGRYLILRNGPGDAHRISGFRLNGDSQTAAITLQALGADHQFYLKEEANTKKRYGKTWPKQKQVVNEVHVYLPYDTAVKEGSYTLTLSNVQKVDVLTHDRKRSKKSYISSSIGVALGAACVALAFAAAAWRGPGR
jgi:hypothetical protein